MEDSIKKYNLNFRNVFIMLIIAGTLIFFAYYMLFGASNEEKFNMFIIEFKTSVRYESSDIGAVYLCGLFAIPVLIYMLELLIYKIKDVLIFSDDGITYYAPEYKKVFIPKDKIKDIYITQRNQIKIILKDYEIKKSIRAIIWTKLKDIYLGNNPKNVFRINLNFIKCDIAEVRKDIMKFNFNPGSSEANEVIKNILQQYNYKNIEELKKDEKALIECVMELYNMEKFTQVEISSMIGINASKVSKIIRKSIN